VAALAVETTGGGAGLVGTDLAAGLAAGNLAAGLLEVAGAALSGAGLAGAFGAALTAVLGAGLAAALGGAALLAGLDTGLAGGLETAFELATGFADADALAALEAAGLTGLVRWTGVLLTEISSQRLLYPLVGTTRTFGRRGL